MKQKIALALGFAVSIASLFYVFSGVDFALLWQALRTFNWLWLLPTLALFYWSMYLRGVRWGLLFRPNYDLSGRRMFRPIMIGFAFNNILPSGRVGEVVRALYVGKREKTGLPTALATIVTERLFDGVTLLACLGGSIALLPPIGPEVTVEFWNFEIQGEMFEPYARAIVRGCAALILAVGIFMIPATPRLMVRAVGALPVLSAEFKEMGRRIIEGVARGFDSIREPKTLLLVVFYSLAIWGLVAASNLLLAYGFVGLTMNYFHALAILGLTAVFIVIPAAPGYWGLYEAGVIFALKVLAIEDDPSVAAAYAIVMHLVQFVPIVVIGLIFAAQSQVRVSRMHE